MSPLALTSMRCRSGCRKIYDALVRYLRSPAVPYKPRVIALLSQLLSSSYLFSKTAGPNLSCTWLEPAVRVGRAARWRLCPASSRVCCCDGCGIVHPALLDALQRWTACKTR